MDTATLLLVIVISVLALVVGYLVGRATGRLSPDLLTYTLQACEIPRSC